MIVTGRRPVLEAVRAGVARSVIVGSDAGRTRALKDLLDEAAASGVPVRRTTDLEMADLAGGSRAQGVVAEVRLPPQLSEADLAARDWADDAIALVLDGVMDPHNLGACARTAEAAGVDVLIVRRPRGSAITPVAVRSSAGALLHLPVARVANLPRALGRLRDAGFWVVGLDGSARRTLAELGSPPGRLCLVLGAEGEGLSRLVRERCDELAAIPLRGRVDSLNVSVAAGIALFAYARSPRDPRRSR